MSATPIPRTLAATLYGDMDISTIMTMPPGRKPIQTRLVEENSLRTIMPQLLDQLEQGGQIYIVCSAIEENENFDGRNVLDIFESLSEAFSGKAKLGLMHGRMSSEEKEQAMHDFEANKTQIFSVDDGTSRSASASAVNACCMVICRRAPLRFVAAPSAARPGWPRTPAGLLFFIDRK